MRIAVTAVALVLAALLVSAAPSAQSPSGKAPKEALQAFNDLIGSWKGTGEPARSGGPVRDFWIETVRWGWRFKGSDAWLTVSFDKSPNFTHGELRYLPKSDSYQLTLHTPAKGKGPLTFAAQFKDRTLTAERKDDKTGATERLTIKLLHPDRHLYFYQVKDAGKTFYRQAYRVGCTRQGVQFASGDGRPECIVSGGLGTIPVMYMGQTYYVCCSGCRTEFNADPAKYVREYNEKKAKKK